MKNLSRCTFRSGKDRSIIKLLTASGAVSTAALGLWAASNLSNWQRQAPEAKEKQPSSAQKISDSSSRPVAYRSVAPGLKTLQGDAALSELKKRGQYASLMGAVKQALYGFKPSGDAASTSGARVFHASNVRHDFAARFDSHGVRVQTTNGESLRLQWQSVERAGGAALSIAPGQVALRGEELQVRRAGATEWFRNGGSGLEQGFTLHQKPAGASEEVRLTLAANGLRARTGKERINLLDNKGQTALTYSKLKVWDADGKVLPSRMEAKDGRILLAMRDKDARYPVTVDPLIASQQAYLKASNTGNIDNFGFSVAISGDTVVVGAIAEASNATGVNGNEANNSAPVSGAAYVFVQSGGPSGTWSQQAYLKASNTGFLDRFGTSVAIAGDTIVVGAGGESSAATGVDGNQADNSASTSGAAYVFVRSGTTWSQQAYLKASNTDANDQFGNTVAVSGETIVVGAFGESSAATGINGDQVDNNASGAGAAYVFVRSGGPSGTWSQQAYLKASNAEIYDDFGRSVAIDGDDIVVGAANEGSAATGANGDQADNTASGAGAAYVFVRTGGLAGTWSQQAYLKASNTNAFDNFGQAVDIDGNTVVVGASLEDSASIHNNYGQENNSVSGAGAAYVFVRSSNTWSQQAYLKASHVAPGDQFGNSVAVSGETVVVGAAGDVNESGAVYGFARYNNVWSQPVYLKASNAQGGDKFGNSVGIDGGTIVVGANQEDSSATGVNGDGTNNNADNSGAAYIFTAAQLLDTTQTGPDFVVNSSDDIDDGTCGASHCTLREAINAANGDVDVSVITFDATVFATVQTIILNGTQLPTLVTDLTITGPVVGVTINANSLSRVFQLQGSTASFSNLTISSGVSTGVSGGGINKDGGSLTLTNCTISGNSTNAQGGGIYNLGTITMRYCTVSGNSSGGSGGGGIYNQSGSSLTISNSTFVGNSAPGGGGGGLGNSGTLTLSNSTLFDNSSSNGTGATSNGTMTVSNCTIAGHTTGVATLFCNGGTLAIGNSILANSNGNIGATGGGTVISQGYNLSSDNSSSVLNQSTDKNSTDPKLDPAGLQNNGGPTQTVALLPDSPAINVGSNALIPADAADIDGDSDITEAVPYDQRGAGFPRVQGSSVDIGAFEILLLTVTRPTVTEGNAGTTTLTFTVTLSSVSTQTVTVDYATADGTTFPATAGSDYVSTSGTLTFAPGDTTETVDVTVNGDTTDEFNERVALQLSNPSGAAIGTVEEGVITDDDPAPSIVINDVQVTESNGGSAQAVFTLTLSAASEKTITVAANTNSNGGSPVATPGVDYLSVTNKTITFAPGVTTQPFNVTILGDLNDENDEKFGVALSGAVNATIADNSSVGTILDNDNPPVIGGTVANVTEGNTGTVAMTFTLKLSAASGKNVSVKYQTANSATFPATPGSDYVAVPQTAVTFLAGETTKTVNVTVNGDLLDEPNERIALSLTNPVNATVGTVTDGVIVDDEVMPGLSINGAQVVEGNSGTRQMIFTVTLSAPSGQTVTVNAATGSAGSPAATAGVDYMALASTPITFAPGETTKQISITIYGDTTVEASEKFGVILSGAVNATLTYNSAIGTIINDDAAGAPAPAEAPSGGEDAK